jgi:cell division protein FtsI (penicillin-binding protein 3)
MKCFDAVTPKLETFEKNVQALSDSLSVVLDKSSSFISMN